MKLCGVVSWGLEFVVGRLNQIKLKKRREMLRRFHSPGRAPYQAGRRTRGGDMALARI